MFDFKVYYENFSLDNPTVSLTVIIWALCIGLCVGVVLYTLSKHATGIIVKALASGEHFTAESALPFTEIKKKPTFLFRRALKDGQALRKYVVIANADECRTEADQKSFFAKVYKFFKGENVPAKYDLSKARLYLIPEEKHTAEHRFVQKGIPALSVILSCVVFLLIAVGLTFCMPKHLELIDSMISAYKNL